LGRLDELPISSAAPPVQETFSRSVEIGHVVFEHLTADHVAICLSVSRNCVEQVLPGQFLGWFYPARSENGRNKVDTANRRRVLLRFDATRPAKHDGRPHASFVWAALATRRERLIPAFGNISLGSSLYPSVV